MSSFRILHVPSNNRRRTVIKRILVRCPSTGRLAPTGKTVEEAAWDNHQAKSPRLTCPHCDEVHNWTKKDVVLLVKFCKKTATLISFKHENFFSSTDRINWVTSSFLIGTAFLTVTALPLYLWYFGFDWFHVGIFFVLLALTGIQHHRRISPFLRPQNFRGEMADPPHGSHLRRRRFRKFRPDVDERTSPASQARRSRRRSLQHHQRFFPRPHWLAAVQAQSRSRLSITCPISRGRAGIAGSIATFISSRFSLVSFCRRWSALFVTAGSARSAVF